MKRSGWWSALLAMLMGVFAAGCSSDPAEVVASVSSTVSAGDGGSAADLTEEEADALAMSLGRADLELLAEVRSVSDSGVTVGVVVRSLASLNALMGPSVVVDLPAGASIVGQDGRCQTVESVLTCRVADLMSGGESGPNGSGVSAEFVFDVEPGSVAPTVTLTAVSRDNPLENDPDPSNNVVTLDLVAG